jgi:RNA polymerase sigma-B factor
MPSELRVAKPAKTDRPPGVDIKEVELFARHAAGDAAAIDTLVRQFTPLATSLARRYSRSSEPFDDLLQVASVGLLKALNGFDPTRGYRFSAFAVPTILGELRRHFRDSGWSVHVPRGVQERALKVRDAQRHLGGEHGHAPTVGQIAEYLRLDSEKVIDALQSLQAYEALSLDATLTSGADDLTTYVESIGQEDARYELVESRATISAVIDRVPALERTILRMRFVDDLTQTEIGTRLEISQMQVSRLLRRALERLRVLTRDRPVAQLQSQAASRPGPAPAQLN